MLIIIQNTNITLYNINNKLPISFNDMFKQLSEPNRTKNFLLEKAKFKKFEWFSKVTLPRVWNSLTLEMKPAKSLNIFKRIFKSERIAAYKNSECLRSGCYSCRH